MLAGVLGLAENENLAYRELIMLPSASAEELAPRLDLSAADLRHALMSLERNGLAARTGGDPSRFVASPPAIALGALMVARQNELRLAELELGNLDDLYRQAAAKRGSADVIDVVYGREALRQRFQQLQHGARSEVLAFVKPPVIAVTSAENTAEDGALARGVDYRVVLERSMLSEGVNSYDELVTAADAGEEIRIADRVPLKLVIIDRELAYLPIMSDADVSAEGAIVVHESGLLDALVALFESTWRHATPAVAVAKDLDPATWSELDDVDAQVLSLLLAGFTDQAASKHLGMSLRTVQRRVRQLMELAGVATRIQLGWYAARNGWI